MGNKPHQKPWGMKAIKQFFSEERGYIIEERIVRKQLKYRILKNIGGVYWQMGVGGWFAHATFVRNARKSMKYLIDKKMEQKEKSDK